jgi:hypothetical protein
MQIRKIIFDPNPSRVSMPVAQKLHRLVDYLQCAEAGCNTSNPQNKYFITKCRINDLIARSSDEENNLTANNTRTL